MDYATEAVELPSPEVLYADLLPHAEYIARQLHLEDPQSEASAAVTDVVLYRRYQERWKPGEAAITVYLYSMVQNRLRDAARKQNRRARWGSTVPIDELGASARATYGTVSASHDGAGSDIGTDDTALADAETLTDLAWVRASLAELDDPFPAALLDELAARALACEPITYKGIARALGVTPRAVRLGIEHLRLLLGSALQAV